MSTRLFLFFFILMSFKANSTINPDASKPCEFKEPSDLQEKVEESIQDKEEIIKKELENLRAENKKLKEEKKKEFSSVDDSSSILLMSQITSLLSSQQMMQMQMMQMMSQMQMNSSFSMSPYAVSVTPFQSEYPGFNPYTYSQLGGFGIGIPFNPNPYSQFQLDRQMLSPNPSFGFSSPMLNSGFDFSQNSGTVIHEPFQSDLNTFSRLPIDNA